MSHIVAGRFETTAQVLAVLTELDAAHFNHEEFASYYVNPPGQHGLYPLGGDEFADSHATKAGGGTVSGATLGGAAGLAIGGVAATIAPEAGAVAALAAGSVGAYVGSLLGALNKLEDGSEVPEVPTEAGAGPMVAICVDRPGTEQIARAALHRHGARAIERVDGRWEDGDWKDFDPRAVQAVEEQH
ncbi:MAG: putative rane protein [Betaproteobacteria bacterium]|nr:putative rane protein [Betaproteobacteria bacterium]